MRDKANCSSACVLHEHIADPLFRTELADRFASTSPRKQWLSKSRYVQMKAVYWARCGGISSLVRARWGFGDGIVTSVDGVYALDLGSSLVKNRLKPKRARTSSRSLGSPALPEHGL